MTTEFDLIFAEFASELDALSEMASIPRGTGGGAPSARARIAAGNGATLLLAATFEEFVRQQVRAAFREKAKNAKGMSSFPAKIVSAVWRTSLESLARTPFDEIEADGSKAGAVLAQTQLFCLRKDITADVADALSKNEYNMRPGEIGRLFNQIGIVSIVSKISQFEPLIEFVGLDTAGKTTTAIEGRIEEFFRKRNEIAHAIKLSASSGASQLASDIEFFRVIGQAMTYAIDQDIKAANANLELAT